MSFPNLYEKNLLPNILDLRSNRKANVIQSKY